MNRLPAMPLRRVVVAWLLAGAVAHADAPPGRYEVNNGTAKDTKTTLVWQRTPHSLPLGWSQAVSHCASFSLAGHSDWRLPTAAELESLTDVRRADEPFLDPNAFPPEDGNDEAAVFWSSTEHPSDVAKAFVVGTGESDYTVARLKVDLLAVRCVRLAP